MGLAGPGVPGQMAGNMQNPNVMGGAPFSGDGKVSFIS